MGKNKESFGNKELLQELNKLKEIKKKNEENSRLKIKALEKQKKKFWEKDNKNLEEKKKKIKFVLNWIKKLKKDCPTIFNEFEEIELFLSNYGHEPGLLKEGCWSKLILNNKGQLIYRSGYKWMPHYFGKDTIFDLDKADKFLNKYINNVYNFFLKGDVYNSILDYYTRDLVKLH